MLLADAVAETVAITEGGPEAEPDADGEGAALAERVTTGVREFDAETVEDRVPALLLEPVAEPAIVLLGPRVLVGVADVVEDAVYRTDRVGAEVAVVVLEVVIDAVLVFDRGPVRLAVGLDEPVFDARIVKLAVGLAVPLFVGARLAVCVTETRIDLVWGGEALEVVLAVGVFDSRILRVWVADALGDLDSLELAVKLGDAVCVRVGRVDADPVFDEVTVRLLVVDPVIVFEAATDSDRRGVDVPVFVVRLERVKNLDWIPVYVKRVD